MWLKASSKPSLRIFDRRSELGEVRVPTVDSPVLAVHVWRHRDPGSGRCPAPACRSSSIGSSAAGLCFKRPWELRPIGRKRGMATSPSANSECLGHEDENLP